MSNNKTVDFNKLREIGIYSNFLLDEIEKGNYKVIEELVDNINRQDRDFMEPLLYAVKNERNTYSIYQFYGKNLQEDIDLASDIIIDEPELIEGTAVSNNAQFILKMAEVNPEVVLYMSSTLKENPEFVEDLCKLNNKEITENVAKECKMPETIIENPNLSEDKTFMIEVIKENPQTLEYASDDLKNDYDFIKETCETNKGTIDYIADHTDDFGVEGLKAAEGVLKEDFKQQVKDRNETEINLIPELKRLQELQENEQNLSDEERVELKQLQERQDLKKLQEDMDRRSEKNGKPIDLEAREKNLKRHGDILDRRLEGLEEGNERAIKFAKRLLSCDLDPEYREMIEKSLKIGEAILEKQKETKEKEDITNEKQEKAISIGEIESVTQEASHKGIKEETGAIREGIIAERNPGIDKIGEKTNEDDGART